MAGPFISKENEQSVLQAIKAKLDAKANATHTHQQSDVTGLTDALAGKAAAVHTHVCTDITDLETTLNEYAKKSDIASVYRYKGATTWSELIAKADAQIGDTYNVTDKDGMNYACILANTAGADSWDALGVITQVSLDNYYTITQVDSTFLKKTDAASTYAPISHTHEIANVNGLQDALDGKAPSTHTHTSANITDFQTAVDARITANVRALTSEEVEEILAALG